MVTVLYHLFILTLFLSWNTFSIRIAFNIFFVQPYAKRAFRVPKTGREIQFRLLLLTTAVKVNHFYICRIPDDLQHVLHEGLHICGIILQNHLDW
jgi:hypothetical protein